MKSLLLLLVTTFLTVEVLANPLADSTDLERYFTAQQISATPAEDGLYFKLDREGKGAYATRGDYVMVAYTGKLLNGQVFDQSADDSPFVFQLGYRQVIRGWEKGIPLFRVGSKGQLFVPAHLGYGSVGAGRAIPPNSDLIYELEVLEIMDIDRYDQYMEELERREQQLFEQERKQQFTADKKKIHEYTVSHKLKTKRLPSGMSYALKKKGKGKLPRKGDILTVYYEGRLLDGTVFDSSFERKESFQFALGKGEVIEGWDDGLQYFKKGSEGWLLIPSKMAYGPRSIEEGDLHIPANAVLIFKIKVLNIERRNENY